MFVKRLQKGIRRLCNSFGYDIVRYTNSQYPLPRLRPEFRHLTWSSLAMQKLLDDYDFKTVLDVGCGGGEHLRIFDESGKTITGIDYNESRSTRYEVLFGDFNTFDFKQTYDCIWASHLLEHQPNVNIFLKKIFDLLNDGGIAAITVPTIHFHLAGGHLTIWTPGLLLYNFVLAGFDCKTASVATYCGNISLIVRKQPIVFPKLTYDTGDIDRLSAFLPDEIQEGGNGMIQLINW